MKAFCCWSGGKESALSLYKAKEQGIDIICLLNMVSEDGKHSRSHGLSSDLLIRQAECLDIPLIQPMAAWENYEREFKKAVSGLTGIDAGIFGDIDMQEHRDWVERVCGDLGIMPVLPLWKGKREDLLQQFIKAGFEAIVVAVNADFMGKDWLGRTVDNEFIQDLKTAGNIDLCGEKGEYHTFVFNGPIFKNPADISPHQKQGFWCGDITIGERVNRDNCWFLNLK